MKERLKRSYSIELNDQMQLPISISRYVYMDYRPCENCHKLRLVRIKSGNAISKLCKLCSNQKNSSHGDYFPHGKGKDSCAWKGGRTKAHGYITIRLEENSPYISMASKNRGVYEHRLIMAYSLGRCLDKTEVVHHLNGNCEDNRIENLSLIGKETHNMALNKEVKTLRWRIIQLEEKCRSLEEKVQQKEDRVNAL